MLIITMHPIFKTNQHLNARTYITTLFQKAVHTFSIEHFNVKNKYIYLHNAISKTLKNILL